MGRYLKIYKLKKNIKPEALCNGLPPEMTEFIRYAKHLEFEQQPDYKYLKKLFNGMLKRFHNTNDQLIILILALINKPILKRIILLQI